MSVARAHGLPDPPALADRQLTLDRERTSRFPALFTRKLQRMSASPLAFLRGAAPLFYEMLKTSPHLADGPPGEGWLVGDLHLENFGAFRTESKDQKTVFDLNDFDDAVIAPWRFDVLRLTTSLLLGGRELGASGILALELSDRLLEAYARSAFDGAPPPEAPAPVRTLVEQVRSRSQNALLDARTRVHGGKRRFVRGPRYVDLEAKVLEGVPKAFAAYAASLSNEARGGKHALDIVDCALRVAGTGSLGGLRVAVLVVGKGGGWIFDMKEQGDPSASVLVGAPKMVPSERVATGFRACVERPARMIGTTHLTNLSMFVRRLAPQEDKLNYRGLKTADLPALAAYLGSLLGAAHARGATKAPKTRWSRSDLAGIRERAITLAGIHEAIYLALCDRMRELLPAYRRDGLKEFFDAIARRYDRDFALSGALSRERLARMVRAIEGRRRVLVLGLGTGRELPALLDAAHEVQGIEVSEAMIAECNKRSRTVPIVRGDFYEPLPFPNGSFDAVIALHGTLAHPPHERAHRELAHEVARVLSGGGVLYAEVPAAEGLAQLGVATIGARAFVHRDAVSGIEVRGVALTKDEWREAFAPALAARVEPLNDVEHVVVASHGANHSQP